MKCNHQDADFQRKQEKFRHPGRYDLFYRKCVFFVRNPIDQPLFPIYVCLRYLSQPDQESIFHFYQDAGQEVVCFARAGGRKTEISMRTEGL